MGAIWWWKCGKAQVCPAGSFRHAADPGCLQMHILSNMKRVPLVILQLLSVSFLELPSATLQLPLIILHLPPVILQLLSVTLQLPSVTHRLPSNRHKPEAVFNTIVLIPRHGPAHPMKSKPFLSFCTGAQEGVFLGMVPFPLKSGLLHNQAMDCAVHNPLSGQNQGFLKIQLHASHSSAPVTNSVSSPVLSTMPTAPLDAVIEGVEPNLGPSDSSAAAGSSAEAANLQTCSASGAGTVSTSTTQVASPCLTVSPHPGNASPGLIRQPNVPEHRAVRSGDVQSPSRSASAAQLPATPGGGAVTSPVTAYVDHTAGVLGPSAAAQGLRQSGDACGGPGLSIAGTERVVQGQGAEARLGTEPLAVTLEVVPTLQALHRLKQQLKQQLQIFQQQQQQQQQQQGQQGHRQQDEVKQMTPPQSLPQTLPVAQPTYSQPRPQPNSQMQAPPPPERSPPPEEAVMQLQSPPHAQQCPQPQPPTAWPSLKLHRVLQPVAPACGPVTLRCVIVGTHQALNVSMVSEHYDYAQPYAPSCFVTYELHGRSAEGEAMLLTDPDCSLTHAVDASCAPVWDVVQSVRVDAAYRLECGMFHLWHRVARPEPSPAPGQSKCLGEAMPARLLGSAFVDLCSVQYGISRVEGWYHIHPSHDVDRQSTIGQLRVAIAVTEDTAWPQLETETPAVARPQGSLGSPPRELPPVTSPSPGPPQVAADAALSAAYSSELHQRLEELDQMHKGLLACLAADYPVPPPQ